jgi:prophage DNA circulation protein
MQINATNQWTPPVSEATRRSATEGAARAGDQATFASADALRQALEQAPDVRPEEISRMQEAAGETTYPPIEMIRRIADLFAIHIDSDQP